MNTKLSSARLCELQCIAWELRLDALRMIYAAMSGHPGGSLSSAEIITALIFHTARLEPMNPSWRGRDRIFISKGHCAPLYYAALARRGFFPRDELASFRQFGSRLQGHPDRIKLPGVEMSSGPLGLGASVAVGCALGLRMDNIGARVYCLLGDGEIQEGIVWEAAMCAAKYHLSNLVFILDYNRYQLTGAVSNVMPLEPLSDKWQSFGWRVLPVDGHDMDQVVGALDEAAMESVAAQSRGTADFTYSQPSLILATTTKGKGVSYMENTSAWHGRAPTPEQMTEAEAEIQAHIDTINATSRGGCSR